MAEATPASHDPPSQGSQGGNYSRARCTICNTFQCINSDGLVRKHNFNSRNCPGSRKPPVAGSTQQAGAGGVNPPDLTSSDNLLDAIKASSGRTLSHIPKAARHLAARKYTDLLKKVNDGSTNLTSDDTIRAWHNLLLFGNACLAVPARGGRSLASSVIKTLNEYPRTDNLIRIPHQRKKVRRHRTSELKSPNIRTLVSSKIEDGNTIGALRIVTSEDTLAPRDATTAQALRDKHPPRAPSDSNDPLIDFSSHQCLTLNEPEVFKAALSFPSGSAGGFTGVRPQHIKEMINPALGPAATNFLTELTKFVNQVLAGKIPPPIRPLFFGASLCALKKKDGGIRPIAVGNTLRRLVARAAVKSVSLEAASLLSPKQLGFGIPLGCEAAAHAARAYVRSLAHDIAMIKLDFKNAFNLVKRDVVIREVHQYFPNLLPFVHTCYSVPSTLLFGDHEIESAEGVQQGDPLAPLLFCLATKAMLDRLSSELNIWFLDDGTLGGTTESLTADLALVKELGEARGLSLNPSKCEIITSSPEIADNLSSVLPGASIVDPEDSILLGAPLGPRAIDVILDRKVEDLKRMEERINSIDAHDAFFLLTKCLTLPRLTYFLRASPSFDSDRLGEYDKTLKSTFEKTLNIYLEESQWKQATLPVRLGGIGIRTASQIAAPAFLSSTAASSELVSEILPEALRGLAGVHDRDYISAAGAWDNASGNSSRPTSPWNHKQKCWDKPIAEGTASAMLDQASARLDQASSEHDRTEARIRKAHLQAVRAPHAGDFLLAVPNSSLGTRLDPHALRIGIALRLAAPIYSDYQCICGREVADQFGRHALSCKSSVGRYARHSEINDIISRSLASANCPVEREPQLLRPDGSGKRPDGVTSYAWKRGRQLVWDYTCASTLAETYLERSSESQGGAADFREQQKRAKYEALEPQYIFVPIGSETLGPWGKNALHFLSDLGSRLIETTKDERAASFLFQRLSIAIQRGNASCIIGSRPSSEGLDELSNM